MVSGLLFASRTMPSRADTRPTVDQYGAFEIIESPAFVEQFVDGIAGLGIHRVCQGWPLVTAIPLAIGNGLQRSESGSQTS